MEIKRNKKFIFLKLAFIVLLLALIIILGSSLFPFFQNPQRIEEFIKQYGIFAPLVFIILQTIQVIVAPLPGQVSTFLGGFLFGQWYGLLYSLIGIAFGSFLALLIGRKFGRPVIKYFVSPKTMGKFERIINNKNSLLVIFLIFLFPFFPDDAICFLSGLTNFPLSLLLFVAMVGRLPTIILTIFFGYQIRYINFPILLFYLIIFIIFSIFFLLLRKRIENYLSIKSKEKPK